MEGGSRMVSGVPSHWIAEGGKVKWPKTKNPSKISKAIQQSKIPGDDWVTHKCKLLKVGIGKCIK